MNRTAKSILLFLQLVIAISVTIYVFYHISVSGIAINQLLSDDYTSQYILTLLSILVHALLIAIFGITFYMVFGKAAYPEVTFIMVAALFLVSLNLRVFFISDRSLALPVIHMLQRAVYFLWLMYALLLFSSGLFHNGVAYLKQHLFIIISFFTALLMVYLIPVTTTMVTVDPHEMEIPISLFVRLLELFTVINYIVAAVRNNNRLFFMIAFGLLLFIAGNELFITSPTPIFLVSGAVLFVIGSLILIRTFYRLHLWS